MTYLCITFLHALRVSLLRRTCSQARQVLLGLINRLNQGLWHVGRLAAFDCSYPDESHFRRTRWRLPWCNLVGYISQCGSEGGIHGEHQIHRVRWCHFKYWNVISMSLLHSSFLPQSVSPPPTPPNSTQLSPLLEGTCDDTVVYNSQTMYP